MVGLMWFPFFPQGAWAADGEGGQASTASFGEVVERQLPAPSYVAVNQVVLNLDNGELLSMPTNIWMAGFFNPRPRFEWKVKHGADLQVDGCTYTNLSFDLDDGRLAMVGKDLSFETIAASEVHLELARAAVFQHLRVPKPEKGPGATLVFKTREGGVGVMQVLGLSTEPDPVLKLRYKLVRGSSARGQPSPGSRRGACGSGGDTAERCGLRRPILDQAHETTSWWPRHKAWQSGSHLSVARAGPRNWSEGIPRFRASGSVYHR